MSKIVKQKVGKKKELPKEPGNRKPIYHFSQLQNIKSFTEQGMREETLRLSMVLVEIIEQKQDISSEKTNEKNNKNYRPP